MRDEEVTQGFHAPKRLEFSNSEWVYSQRQVRFWKVMVPNVVYIFTRFYILY